MAFFSLVNAERVTVATDRTVVPAREVAVLSSALDIARQLSELHVRTDERVRAAERAGREAGRREAIERIEAEAAETLAERLLALERDAARERDALRARAVDNALGIVRRIASTLGESETLAALAFEAARALLPDGALVVQVHPERVDEVRTRLAGHFADAGTPEVAALVEAEESLEPGQCRLRAANGAVVLAGLETQLRHIERQVRDAHVAGDPAA